MGTNLIANVSFFPVVAVTHDEDLTGPFGMTVIDNTLWVANNFSGFLTHYAPTGLKLAPVRVVPFETDISADVITWCTFINANIAGLPLNNNNLLIALGMPVTTFVQFRNEIQGILNKTITVVPEKSANAIFKVYQDYQNSVNPTQTMNDMIAAVAVFQDINPEDDGVPVLAVVGNPTQGFPISWQPNPSQPVQTAASYLLAAATNGTI